MNAKQKEYVNRNNALVSMLNGAVPAGLDVVTSLVRQCLTINQTLDKKEDIKTKKESLKSWIKDMKQWSEEFDGDLSAYSQWLAEKVDKVIPEINEFTGLIENAEVRERGTGGSGGTNTEFMISTPDGESVFTDQKLANLFMGNELYNNVMTGKVKFSEAFTNFMAESNLKLVKSKKIEHDTPQNVETLTYLVSRKVIREVTKPLKVSNPNRKDREPSLPSGDSK